MMKNNSIIETAIAVRVDRTLGKCTHILSNILWLY